jgi:hypothetical protein
MSLQDNLKSIKERERIKVNGSEKTFSIITGKELMNRPVIELPMLAQQLIPKVGISIFAGASDLGKSAWLRQLAVHLVSGEERYCGFKLQPQHKNVLFVCSEDDENATTALLHKICDDGELLAELRFVFDSEDLESTIRKALTATRSDLVVVDCLLDFFGRGNLNQANEVRTWLNPFKRLAAEFETQIIFLHHLAKRSDEREPNKAALLGSGALEHAPRLVLELRAGDDTDQRYLCILKGNFLPDTVKGEAHELRFDNMRFKSTGIRKPLHEIVKRSPERSPEQREQLITETKKLADTGLSQRKIGKQLGIAPSTVNDYLKRSFGQNPMVPNERTPEQGENPPF